MKSFFLSILFMFIVISVKAQTIYFPDANLKSYLLLADATNQIAYDLNDNTFKIDSNNNGEIEQSEANQVSEIGIDPSFFGLNNFISSFSGLENFANLTTLTLVNLVGETTFSVENLSNIEILNISYLYPQELLLSNLSNLNELNLSNIGDSLINFNNCENLEILNLVETQITEIDLSTLVNLKEFYTYGSELESLDFTNNLNFETLNLDGAPNILELDLSQNNNLLNVFFTNCGTIDVDLSTLSNLVSYGSSNTHVSIVDLSQSPNISTIYIGDFSNIDFLNIKNGTLANNINLVFANINYLCADENEVDTINLSNANVQSINSYCSFSPGGEYYILEGENKIDSDLNGCGSNDYPFPNLKFNISNANANWMYFSDASGQYNIPLSEGLHAISPHFENADYFTGAPNSVSVDFPSDASPYTQDFCITPNNVYKDLELSIVPLTSAIPGFESSYRILYKNIGNSVIDFGQILLTNDFDLMTEVAFNPSWDSFTTTDQAWHFNYEDLHPFEIRTIDFTMVINTPTDAFNPVNDGDVLTFNVNHFIEYDVIDESANVTLNQTVINSYDPNDITCLEGDVISPEAVGKYVHYLIRFENLGTAHATNIVVKNTIDVTKFDINSLVPIDGSHNYYTRINTSNDVEFIFENIQLPFDDATNDGYVTYKIKTLESLVLGDEFSNQAEIYFDFNPPVITNSFTTEVAEDNLSTQNFDLSSLKVYPNPVHDILNIETEFPINAIHVFDIEGREVLEIHNSFNQINLSAFEIGVYVVKVISGSKTETLKVIKN